MTAYEKSIADKKKKENEEKDNIFNESSEGQLKLRGFEMISRMFVRIKENGIIFNLSSIDNIVPKEEGKVDVQVGGMVYEFPDETIGLLLNVARTRGL